MAADPQAPRARPAAAKPTRVSATKDAGGAETRDRILEAAQRRLQTEGIVGASSRAIARHGDFNQALIFYHFGSVDGLLQATAREDADRRAARYADRLALDAMLRATAP